MTEEGADDAPITFNIKSSSEAKYSVTVPRSTTVLELKEKLSSTDYANLPPERQRLIYSGRVMKDVDSLGTYNIAEGNTVHLVRGAASNQQQNSGGQGASSSAAAPTLPTMAAGTGNNPLAGLTGARYAGFANLPSQNMFGPDGGMGPPPDPEQMAAMMQNPQFQSTLNEALQNPQLIEMMIQQNPMLRSMGPQVRQMMQTPEFRRMMTDPEQLRNMARMHRQFGGGMGGMGGGATAFPAPGMTDTTPGQEGNRQGAAQQPPVNPFAALMGAPPGFGGAQAAANPFAALFAAPPTSNTPTTSPPPTASAGQGTPATPSTPQGGERATSQPPNPWANLQQMAQMMQQLQAAQPGLSGTTNPNPSDPASANAENSFAALMAAMQANGGAFGGIPPYGAGAGGFPSLFEQVGAASHLPQDSRPPEERYAEQLRQLNDMGFYGFERNVEALRRTGGSVNGAVEYLLNHPS